ncbi:MAG: hypothetical protein QOK17_1746 [Sphingomonadales bacterium]|jgi:hypothetical protein|nr:hypothetical protein [Sphingomonadales bacterium]
MKRLGWLMATFALPLAASALPAPAMAAISCYNHPSMRALKAKAPPLYYRDVLVLIDQTILAPPVVRQQLADEIGRLAIGGTRVSVGSFSAYAGNNFPRILGAFLFEPDIQPSKLQDVGMRSRRAMSACVVSERSTALLEAQNLVANVLNGGQPSLGHSDILSSLQQFSARVRSSPLGQRYLILVSDMLENSSTTSFYARNTVRAIDPGRELGRVQAAGLLADFGNAKVLVLGAGLLPSTINAPMRTDDVMRRLETFWRAYFSASHALVAGFGKPILLAPIQ